LDQQGDNVRICQIDVIIDYALTKWIISHSGTLFV